MNNEEPKVLFTIDESSEAYQNVIKSNNIKYQNTNNLLNKEFILNSVEKYGYALQYVPEDSATRL